LSKIRFGISPLTWTNDDMPELGGDIPLSTCLHEMSVAGFQGTEMGTKYPRVAEQLSTELDKHGLVLASGWYSGNLIKQSVAQEIESVQSHLTLLKSLGCDVMVMGEVSNSIHGKIDIALSERVILSPEEWVVYGKKLTEFADYLLANGMRLGYHNHVGTIVQTVSDIDTFMEVTGPSVGLTIDTGHITFAGGDPVDIIQRFSDRIVHVHTKDVRQNILDEALTHNWSFLKAVLEGVFTVPGDGCIDFEAVFKQLYKEQYSGWILVEAEQDPEKYHPLTYAQLAFKNLRSYSENAGYSV
jgi:inosose dehydratase